MKSTRRLIPGLATVGLIGATAAALASPAQAAIPDHWGFAYVNKPAVPGIPDVNHQAGSWPAPLKVHVKPGVVGQVFVAFPRIASQPSPKGCNSCRSRSTSTTAPW